MLRRLHAQECACSGMRMVRSVHAQQRVKALMHPLHRVSPINSKFAHTPSASMSFPASDLSLENRPKAL
eukprot:10053954-Lingulodinium_polyedra.AAC.1